MTDEKNADLNRQYLAATLRDAERIAEVIDKVLEGEPGAALSEYDLAWLRAGAWDRRDAAMAQLAGAEAALPWHDWAREQAAKPSILTDEERAKIRALYDVGALDKLASVTQPRVSAAGESELGSAPARAFNAGLGKVRREPPPADEP